jgi:alkanesulfonate monooxygenase SsuD/methylene tetrahydromethanopterin reductase-like flavin-dependent oxidoreductase (luciferase family)
MTVGYKSLHVYAIIAFVENLDGKERARSAAPDGSARHTTPRRWEKASEEECVDVGIGLPNGVPNVSGRQLVEWARRADARGFSTLGTIDRLVYGNYEPLTALTAAAAVTERIGLTTAVILGPLRGNPHALAKQTQSIHALSGGRLTLGLGLGSGRNDDYVHSRIPMSERATRQDELIELLQADWADERIGPANSAPPRILVGGAVPATYERAARFGAGWIAAGASPEEFADSREQVEAAWTDAGRTDRPFVSCLTYFALGDDADQLAQDYLGHYYAFLGEEVAAALVEAAAKDADAVRSDLVAYEQAGCDEIILFPCASDPEQVDRLADVVGL